jgi:ribosomal protein L11 methyltransferase
MSENPPQEYIEARLEVPREYADAVCDFIIQNIAGGIVLEDEDDSPTVGIQFYVGEAKTGYREQLAGYLASILSDRGIPVPAISERRIKNLEWINEYRASIKPIRIANDVVVRPPWHAPLPNTRYDIVIEPRMAFGTGSHETTRSCIRLIREQLQPGTRFLDLGTGSGILSILAAKMGATYVKAIDYDLTAVQNAKENFAVNDVSVPYDILFGSMEKCELDEPYDFVCANIIKSTILPMLGVLVKLTCSGGTLMLSGLLPQDEEDISAALRALGEPDFSILRDNKWLTYAVRKR